jgi:hypothetical protein
MHMRLKENKNAYMQCSERRRIHPLKKITEPLINGKSAQGYIARGWTASVLVVPDARWQAHYLY